MRSPEEHEIKRVADEINASGGKAIACATDVTDVAAVERLADAALSEYGSLNMWVNNAGGSPTQAPLVDIEPAGGSEPLLNLTAVWHCTRVAAQKMDEGRVLNISSLAAEDVIPGSGHYSAAKAGVNMLTKTFAKELGPRIRVNCIMPGAVPTEIMMEALSLKEDDLPGLEKMLRLPAGRLGTPEDLGMAALYLLFGKPRGLRVNIRVRRPLMKLQSRTKGIPQGELQAEHMAIIEEAIPELAEDQCCFKSSIYRSMRLFERFNEGAFHGTADSMPIVALGIGRVIDSRFDGLNQGDAVFGPMGAQTRAVLPGAMLQRIDEDELPARAHLGVLGVTTGLTAYAESFVSEKCKPATSLSCQPLRAPGLVRVRSPKIAVLE